MMRSKWAIIVQFYNKMAPVFEQFALADQYATSKGSKICALSCAEGVPVEVVAQGTVKAPFEPGNFAGGAFGDKTWSARQTLQLRCGADLEDYFKGLDEWAIDYITEHAERLLKKPMTGAGTSGLHELTVAEGTKPHAPQDQDQPRGSKRLQVLGERWH